MCLYFTLSYLRESFKYTEDPRSKKGHLKTKLSSIKGYFLLIRFDDFLLVSRGVLLGVMTTCTDTLRKSLIYFSILQLTNAFLVGGGGLCVFMCVSLLLYVVPTKHVNSTLYQTSMVINWFYKRYHLLHINSVSFSINNGLVIYTEVHG